MKTKITLTWLILLLTISTFSQNKNKELEHTQSELDIEKLEFEEAQKIKEEQEKIITESFESKTDYQISKLGIKYKIYPIRYQDGLEINIEFNKNKYGIMLEYLVKGIKGTLKSKVLRKNQTKVSFSGLDLDKDYEIYYTYVTEKGEQIKQEKPFTLLSKPQDLITVSTNFYKELSKWSVNKRNISMQTLLNSLSKKGISNEAIVSYAQQFFKNSILLKDKNNDLKTKLQLIFKKGPKPPPSQDKCNCQPVTDGVNMGPGDYNSNGWMIPYQTGFSDEGSGYSFGHNFKISRGPSKKYWLRSHGSGWGSNHVMEINDVGIDDDGYSSSPTYISHNYTLICLNEDYEANCDCSKTIKIDYKYHAQYVVEANAIGNGGNRKASAMAEELATVTVKRVTEINDDDLELLDAARSSVNYECEMDWHPNFFDNVVALGGSTYGVGSTIANSAENLTQEDLESFLTDLAEVIQNPVFEFSGDCGTLDQTQTLLDATKYIEMKSNEPVSITLSSFSHLGVRGQRKWNSESTVNSSFSFTTIIEPGYEDLDDDSYVNCCSDRIAHWNAAAIGGPTTLQSVQGVSANFIEGNGFNLSQYGLVEDAYGTYMLEANGGYFVKDIDCDKNNEPTTVEEINNCYKVVIIDDNLNVKSSCNNKEVNVLGLKIYNFQGNLVNQYNTSNINLSHLKGLYILNIALDNGKIISRKMIF